LAARGTAGRKNGSRFSSVLTPMVEAKKVALIGREKSEHISEAPSGRELPAKPGEGACGA